MKKVLAILLIFLLLAACGGGSSSSSGSTSVGYNVTIDSTVFKDYTSFNGLGVGYTLTGQQTNGSNVNYYFACASMGYHVFPGIRNGTYTITPILKQQNQPIPFIPDHMTFTVNGHDVQLNHFMANTYLNQINTASLSCSM